MDDLLVALELERDLVSGVGLPDVLDGLGGQGTRGDGEGTDDGHGEECCGELVHGRKHESLRVQAQLGTAPIRALMFDPDP